MKKASNQDKKQKHNNKKEKQNEKEQQPDKKDRKIIISKKDEVPSLTVEQKQEPETLKLEIENNWKFYEEIDEQNESTGVDYKTLLEDSCKILIKNRKMSENNMIIFL